MRPGAHPEVAAYDAELLRRVRDVLGGRLVAVYAGGSWALGDYAAGRSDLDRIAASADGLRGGEAEALVASLREEALPCPARALELVVYPLDAVSRPTEGAAFALNLNSGAGVELHAETDPAAEPGHWFVLDRAITREHGLALYGPPALTLFAPLPRPWLVAALRESLAWHRANAETAGEDAVLNACRAWRFLATGQWTAKEEAAAWAAGQEPRLGAVVAAALALRRGEAGAPVDPGAVEELVSRVAAALEP